MPIVRRRPLTHDGAVQDGMHPIQTKRRVLQIEHIVAEEAAQHAKDSRRQVRRSDQRKLMASWITGPEDGKDL